MPIYRCGLKPDKFRHASVNRTSDPGLTRINSGPGSEALVWTRPNTHKSAITIALQQLNLKEPNTQIWFQMTL